MSKGESSATPINFCAAIFQGGVLKESRWWCYPGNFWELLKNCKKNFPILIGGAPSLLDYGDYFFDKINSSRPIILSGSNALFNFLKLEIKIKNPLILILSGSEIKKINISINKNIFKSINLYGIIAEKEFLPKNFEFKNKQNLATSSSVALNPLYLVGLVLINLKVKKFSLAFFDGNPDTEKGRIVMEDTQESVKKISEMGIEINTLTKSYLKVKQLNFWWNDKCFYTYKERE